VVFPACQFQAFVDRIGLQARCKSFLEGKFTGFSAAEIIEAEGWWDEVFEAAGERNGKYCSACFTDLPCRLSRVTRHAPASLTLLVFFFLLYFFWKLAAAPPERDPS
jgi:hypothetical protein